MHDLNNGCDCEDAVKGRSLKILVLEIILLVFFKMDEKIIYAFRGWIGFVAFMDMGTAVRCFIENRSFLGQHNLGN